MAWFFAGMSDACGGAEFNHRAGRAYVLGYEVARDMVQDWDLTPALTVSDYIEVALNEDLGIKHP